MHAFCTEGRGSRNVTVLFVVELRLIECWCTWPQICQSARFTLPSPLPPPCLDVRMGKDDVEEWVFTSTVTTGDSDDTETGGWDKDRVLADWSEGVQIIRKNISSSSTKNRTEFLQGVVIPIVKDESKFSVPRSSWRSRG